MSIVDKSQSGRACAEPASRPSAPRSGGGAKRRALTSVSTRARCWLDDAASDHNILRSTPSPVSVSSSRSATVRLLPAPASSSFTAAASTLSGWASCSASRPAAGRSASCAADPVLSGWPIRIGAAGSALSATAAGRRRRSSRAAPPGCELPRSSGDRKTTGKCLPVVQELAPSLGLCDLCCHLVGLRSGP